MIQEQLVSVVEAAKQGHAEAQDELGRMYYTRDSAITTI